MNKWDKQIDRLVEYFRSGEKKLGEGKNGVEFEHLVLDGKTYETIPYRGPRGIAETFKDLEAKGWIGVYEGDDILGAEKGSTLISTEPALQFEVSFNSEKCLSKLDDDYVSFIKEVEGVFHSKGQILAAIGYQPVTKIDEIEISPKRRYSYMYEHFKSKGSHAHNMMKGTAAVQVVIDYFSEEDFIRKFRIGNALSPILYNVFDNAYFFEGEKYKGNNLRQLIWENTDSERSGVPAFAFDKELSYASYAEYILNNDIIFTDTDGHLEGTQGRPFKDMFDPDKASDKEILHAISIVFPDLRLKKYLEFRMIDSLPYPLNMAVTALIKGLMYSEMNLNSLEEDFNEMTYKDLEEGRMQGKTRGIKGLYLGKTYLEWATYLYDLAYQALHKEERKYLKPMKKILDQGKSPKDIFGQVLEKEGMDTAMDLVKVEV